jgi:hypothetical protein
MVITEFKPDEMFNPIILPKQEVENKTSQNGNIIPLISRISLLIRMKVKV